MPLGIVEEEGRLPLKRGPKALQQNGMPFYHLTKKGMIVSLAIDSISERKKILKDIINQADDDEKQAFQLWKNWSRLLHILVSQFLRDMLRHIVRTS